MFSQNEEKKLDWMYKGPNSTVDREEYLLGRSVDKTLEQINAEEKQQQQAYLAPTKNHVEHECIPPSIRDFNKIVNAEQVDMSAKLQEDPLVAIKKHEEEVRRQFLQNPVQLKKLQEALEAQKIEKKNKKKKKRKKSYTTESESSDNLDTKITKKLQILRDNPFGNISVAKQKKKHKTTALDTILEHKFNAFKDKLTEEDWKDIMNGDIRKEYSSDDSGSKRKKIYKKQKFSSDSEDDPKIREKRRKSKNSPTTSEKKRMFPKHKRRDSPDCSTERNYSGSKINKAFQRNKYKHKRDSSSSEERERNPQKQHDYHKRGGSKSFEGIVRKKNRKLSERDSSSHISRSDKEHCRGQSSTVEYNSSDHSEGKARNKQIYNSNKTTYYSSEDEKTTKVQNWGLVKSDGTKIPLTSKSENVASKFSKKKIEQPSGSKPTEKVKIKKTLSEKEKEIMLKEMMSNAAWRDKEREDKVKNYRENENKESTNTQHYDRDFIHKELLRSANNSSVESRIKSNLNNIQRSSKHMNQHFSKRH